MVSFDNLSVLSKRIGERRWSARPQGLLEIVDIELPWRSPETAETLSCNVSTLRCEDPIRIESFLVQDLAVRVAQRKTTGQTWHRVVQLHLLRAAPSDTLYSRVAHKLMVFL